MTIGFEKEGLRIDRSEISKSAHPLSIGSALCNQYITTDFSEAQLELVTPPLSKRDEAMKFLDDIHHFVTRGIDNELIWPMSMPPSFGFESNIPIASYGSSNLANFKRLYRKGLAERYGRGMQAISGFHFNYSISIEIWNAIEEIYFERFSNQTHSDLYFGIIRNIKRLNWMILYLFGASPIITKDLINKKYSSFKKIDSDTFYMPFATSLRMSEFGYSNTSRNKLNVSNNSLSEYVSDLVAATRTIDPKFSEIEETNQKKAQINPNILQIDDEYYAVARPKSTDITNKRLTHKLATKGVDFIELRSLDLNPFSRVGIDEETAYFLEIFFIYCLFFESPKFTIDDINIIGSNDLLVAKRGRYPNLKLNNNGNQVRLDDWANQITDEMIIMLERLNMSTSHSSKVFQSIKSKINNPETTLSGQLLDKIFSEKMSHTDFAIDIATKNRNYYLKKEKNLSKNFTEIKKEASNSIKKQEKLEKSEKQSFKEFMDDYLS